MAFDPINKILGKSNYTIIQKLVKDAKSKNYIIRGKNDIVKCSECGKVLGKADDNETAYDLAEKHLYKCKGE